MRTLGRTVFTVLLVVLFVSLAHAQESLWKELNGQVTSLYQQGRYAEGVKVAERALQVAQKTFGFDDPNVATSLNDLAELYRGSRQIC